VIEGLRLADPVEAMHTVSHDLGLEAELPLEHGGSITAWQMQVRLRGAVYAVASMVLGTDTKGEPAWEDRQTRNIMAMWGQALADIAAIRHASDDERLAMRAEAGRVEWLFKWQLLERMRRRLGGADWSDPRLAAIDLRWAALDPAESIYAKVESKTERVVDDQGLDHAASAAPEETRAWLRAELVRRFPDEIVAASWSHITVRRPEALRDTLDNVYGNASAERVRAVGRDGLVDLDMSDPLAFGAARTRDALEHAGSAAQALGAISGRS
ncbi:MAG: proteasome accessory factor PafA2 family protein, partial [Bifidobacterium merycicum]|nr:proteasome accessory factor PafA2 family protein [Bifidobacterium merycicum]